MTKKIHPMGSPEWANDVFSSPPVRKLKGHSRRTQHHRYYSSLLGCYVGVQGRNECCSALAIEYLVQLGILVRVKAQPFVTDEQQFGSAIIPDFLTEGSEKPPILYVVETKSARFLTRIKNLELDGYRDRFSKCGLQYLVWTDERPLNHSVRHHLINMRASAQRDVTPAEIDTLLSWVEANSSQTLEAFFANDFDLDCLYAAAWLGKVFFPLTRPLEPATLITPFPQEDYRAIFLACENRTDDWWRALPAC